MLSCTFGSDPELMLLNNNTGKMVSAIPVMNNTKHNPLVMRNGVRMYADNVLVEAAFPPSSSRWKAVDRIKDAFKQMREELSLKFSMVPKAAHVFDEDELSDPKAWEIGCDPNFDVWAGCANEIREFEDGLRTGSFHIHVGNRAWPEKTSGHLLDFRSKVMAVKLMDIFVGVPSVIFDKDPSSKDRRKLYGRAGEHRQCEYGIEYRVLGPYALRDPDLVDLSLMLTEYAMSTLAAGEGPDILKSIPEQDIRRCINECDVELAKKIMEKSALPGFHVKRVLEDRNLNQDLSKWGIE